MKCNALRKLTRILAGAPSALALNLINKLEFSKEKMIVASAAERNKEHIWGVLKQYLPKEDTTAAQVLEISSGPGQHVAHFAARCPQVTWQPSDIETQYLQSISAHTHNAGLSNVKPPVYIDIMKPTDTPDNGNIKTESIDVVLNINLIHISPWDTSLGLFSTAGRVLQPSGVLFMYGPYKIDGVLTPDSNVRFDESLRSSDPRWGIRDVADLKELAEKNGMKFEKMFDMPANNKCITFRKST